MPQLDLKKSSEDLTMLCTPEQELLARQIGNFIHYWGFKRLHGEIWCHIYLAEVPLAASDLIARLKVSKASISIALKELLGYKVIVDAGKDSRGFLSYSANAKIMEVIIHILRSREKKILAEIQVAHHLLAELQPQELKDTKVHPERLKLLGKMTKLAQATLNSLISLNEINMKVWKKFPFS